MSVARKELPWIKIKAIRKRVRHFEIAKHLNIKSNVFTQIINGYKKIPEGFEEKVNRYFETI